MKLKSTPNISGPIIGPNSRGLGEMHAQPLIQVSRGAWQQPWMRTIEHISLNIVQLLANRQGAGASHLGILQGRGVSKYEQNIPSSQAVRSKRNTHGTF